ESVNEKNNRFTQPVTRFWEKPLLPQAKILWAQGALWNSFVCVTYCHTLWEMVRLAAPDIYLCFRKICHALGTPVAGLVTIRIYSYLRPINFSSGVCELWASMLRVLPVPDVGWSDWGSVERIMTTLEEVGKKGELLTRLTQQKPKSVQIANFIAA